MKSELVLEQMKRETSGDCELVTVAVHVPTTLRYLEGHFPGAPIMPGVAQIVALTEEPTRLAWPDLGAVRSLRRVKFTHAIRPGDDLELRLERKGQKVTFCVSKGEDICSKGSIVFS